MVWREWESNTTLLISTVLFLHINKLVAFHLLPNERLESLHEVVFNHSSLCSIRNVCIHLLLQGGVTLLQSVTAGPSKNSS